MNNLGGEGKLSPPACLNFHLSKTGKYRFYEEDPIKKTTVEYSQDLGPNKDQRYWNKLGDLARDIGNVLTKAGRWVSDPAIGDAFKKVAPPSKGAVYLAETTHDRREDRNNIKRELQERGYEVLPEQELPLVSPDYEEAVREYLRRSRLSIHLIGESYGTIPERANNRSVIELQNELAARRSVETSFPRLIWLPENLQPKEDRQAQFIAELKTRVEQQKGAELLQTPLEELKSVIKGKVEALSRNGHKPSPRPAARKKIYLLCDKRDVEQIAPLNTYLVSRKCEVILPLLDDDGADDTQAIKLHEDNLLRCDAVLIFYGKANQFWFSYKLNDLEKITGLEKVAGPERAKPLLAQMIYVAGPQTVHKELFHTDESLLVKNYDAFAPNLLDEFLAQLEAATETADAAKGEDDHAN